MKNTELRINNIITINDKVRQELFHNQINATNDVFKVVTVYSDGDVAIKFDDEVVDMSCDEIEPVLFSEKWKQELGMKCLGKKRNWYDAELFKGLDISINEKGITSLSFGNDNWTTLRNIKTLYVHQFQNLVKDFKSLSA